MKHASETKSMGHGSGKRKFELHNRYSTVKSELSALETKYAALYQIAVERRKAIEGLQTRMKTMKEQHEAELALADEQYNALADRERRPLWRIAWERLAGTMRQTEAFGEPRPRRTSSSSTSPTPPADTTPAPSTDPIEESKAEESPSDSEPPTTAPGPSS